MEDGSDTEPGTTLSIVEVPPEAPVPPPAAPPPPNVNVFDFLVTDDTPNASKVSLAPSDSKSMDYTPSILGSDIGRKQTITEYDPEYESIGFSYGRDPIPSTKRKDRPKVEYITPAAKDLHLHLMKNDDDDTPPKIKLKDKKRKHLQIEELDLTAARRPSQEPDDAVMSDAPPPVLHSGLTGGLNRLLSKSKFPPSPDYSNDPPSPVKRSKKASTSQEIVVRDYRERSKPSTTLAVTKVRKRRTSDESRPRKKKHRTHHHEDSHTHGERSTRQKAIEYPSQSREDSQQQLVVYKSRAELFMSFVTKGEESKSGMSVHKALKRYHRERGRTDLREDEEKELWKGLRLKRNERGEVVVFF